MGQTVFLASIEWNDAFQRHQAWAEAFAAAGQDVFFVENTGFRDLRVTDSARVLRRLGRMASAPLKRETVPVRVVSPTVLPPTRGPFRWLNRHVFAPALARKLFEAGLKPGADVFAYLPTDTTLALLDVLQPGLVVYDCVDHFAGHASPPSDLEATETALLERSDCVITTSPFLEERLRGRHARVHRIHHGVSRAYFEQAPAPQPAFRSFCYFGSLWSAVDYAPIRALAEAGFDVTLIGPVREPLPKLPPSVRVRPPLRAAELPSALAAFDALLLPYVDSQYNQGVTPSKIYECLATGKPTLASPLPGLRQFKDQLYLLADAAAFVDTARRLTELESEDKRRDRVARARENASETQFARLEAALAEARAAHPPGPRPSPPVDLVVLLAKGLGWIGSLYGLARVSTFVGQAVAGRLLGPAEFGRSSLIVATAAVLQILPILGFPMAMAKFVSAEEDPRRQQEILSTLWWVFLGWAAVSLAGLSLASPLLSKAFEVAPELLALSLVYAGLTALYTVGGSPLQGLRRFRERGIAEAAYGLGSVTLLLAAVALGAPRTHRLFIGCLCGALATSSVYSLYSLRGQLLPVLDGRLIRRMLPYMLLATLSLLSAASVVAPGRLFLHQAHGASAVGVFSAYFASTVQVSLALIYIASAVLIPLGSTPERQRELWRHFGRAWAPLTAAVCALLFAACCAALLVFGSRYPLVPSWALLFALGAALVLTHGLAASIFAAEGLGGLAVSVTGGLLAGAGNIGLNAWLTPRLGVPGAAAALVGGYVLGLAWYGTARRLRLSGTGRK